MGNTISEETDNQSLDPVIASQIINATLPQTLIPSTQNLPQQPVIVPAPAPAPAPAPTLLKCSNLNNITCNKVDKCYYINNICSEDTTFFSLLDIESNKIKCTITSNPELPNTFILECINTNYIKNILIKGLIIDNSCLYNYENNYLYNKNCNTLLSNNILINKEFNIKNEIITFNNISGKLTKTIVLTKLQVDKIKTQNNTK